MSSEIGKARLLSRSGSHQHWCAGPRSRYRHFSPDGLRVGSRLRRAPLARTKPGRLLARRGDTRGSGPVQMALDELIILGRVDIHQQTGRKLQDQCPVVVPLEDGTGPMLQLGKLEKELALEQMRRRHDVAVTDADDGRRLMAVRVEKGSVVARRHERLIREREHRGPTAAELGYRRAKRAAHA